MRFLSCLLLSIFIFVLSAAQPASAQSRATSYNFAPSNHMFVDKKSSGLAKMMESTDEFLNNFRGERGMMLFIGSAGLALLALIYGMPQAALSAGIISVGILLINKPLLLAIVLIPAAIVKRDLWLKRFSSDDDDYDDEDEEDEAPTRRKRRKRRRRRAADEYDSIPAPKPSGRIPAKLARPM